MVQFPSNLAFASFLQYRPKSSDPVAKQSQDVMNSVKTDKVISVAGKNVRLSEYAAARIQQSLAQFSFLNTYFGPDVVLVPVPRSSLIQPGALWPAERICNALAAEHLGLRVEHCLVRTKGIVKAATAARGGRPGPQEHYDSLAIVRQQLLEVPKSITVVDDVVTRGATFVGCQPHLAAAFPGVPIHYFAVIRTISFAEIQQILEPIEGTIVYQGGSLLRSP